VPSATSTERGIRNPVGWRDRLARLRGSAVQLDLAFCDAPLAAIEALGRGLDQETDEELIARGRSLRAEARAGAPLEALEARTFALVREAARRTLGLRPFDVQVAAGLALRRGKVVEMQTGEGKTLAAVMPACLEGLGGAGVHVLTFNDYLARRDADWMGPAYRLLGLSVAFVQGGMTRDDRRRAYAADVTYVTAKEAGFDHLRDQLAMDAREVVHRPFHFALVDEADSLLIDEARVPLVVAGSVEAPSSTAHRLADLVAGLQPGVHFDTDEYGRDVELTEAGIERVEQALGCGSLHSDENHLLLSEVNCALHARALLHRDVDYIVRGGRVVLVDELTGRVVDDRHWPDGLQAALEAKEGLARTSDGRILGSITLQHFLGGYPRLGGMTGTARDAAEELRELYGLDVVVIPTHRPVARVDHPDVLFSHREAKERAVVEEVRRAHAAGRPVLVGTLTIEESERLALRLREAGVVGEVLNAKNDAHEAGIVARAGALGAVTISTNMAGRGTDIRLGGPDEGGRERVRALGGLYVVGTNRHESRRVDQQLRGRAGRQGDPGESRFFVSLDDDLLVRYGIRQLLPARLLGERSDEPLRNPVVRVEVARAQRIVEGQNREIRRTLWRYAEAIDEQRRAVVERRQSLLLGRGEPDLWRDDPRHAALVAAAGAEAVGRAERAVSLRELDRAWSEHLSFIAGLREGSHLVGLAGLDPLTRFRVEAVDAFRRMEQEFETAVRETLPGVAAAGDGRDLHGVEVKGPASTWTYLVNDDPFRDHLMMRLTGPGRTTASIGAAVYAMPLFLLWLVTERFWRKRPPRQPPGR